MPIVESTLSAYYVFFSPCNNIRQQGKPKSIDIPIKTKQEIIKIKGKPTILQIKHNPFQSISNQTNIHNYIKKKLSIQ